jgi:ATP-binding cassette subfamily B protein
MVCVSVLNTLFALGNNSFSIQVGEGVARDLRNALFKKIQSFSHGNLDRLKTGELMVLLSSDTGVVQRLFQISLRIGTRAPLLMAGSLALMFSTDPSLALVLLPLLVLVSGIIAFFSAVLSPLFTKLQNVLDGPTKESEIM